MTLRDLFDAMWSITEADITCRQNGGEGLYIHRFLFREKEPTGCGLIYDIKADRVTCILGPINVYGRPTRGGVETGWGYLEKSIPEELMTAPIRHMGVINSYRDGYSVSLDVDLQELTVETLKHDLAGRAWQDWWEE